MPTDGASRAAFRVAPAAALLACLLSACPRPQGTPLPRQPVVTINGVDVPATELRREVWRAAGPPQEPADGGPGMTRLERLALARGLLDALVEHKVLVQAAAADGVTADPDDVEAELARLRAGYRPEDHAAMLHAQMHTQESLKAQVVEHVTVERYLQKQTRSAGDVTDAQVESHYKARQETYRRAARVRARQVVVATPEEARVVRQRLARGEDFARVAREFSVAPEKDRGGDLGVFARGVMPQVFDEVCFKLQPGQLSDVVQSEYGHHVFQVTESFPEQVLPLDAVREEIRSELQRGAREAAEEALLHQLRGRAVVTIHEEALRWAADADAAPGGGGDA